MSGDEAQLEAIAPGAPFRLAQGRSAIDMAVMKEIVRQTPELKPAVYKMIDNDVPGALDVVRAVAPANVPRQADAWVPTQSVVEYPAKGPDDIHAAIVSDYLGRTEAARRDTLIITHLNADRHIINAGIHQERKAAGELKGEAVSLPILETANIRDGELRKLDTWARHRDAVVLLDNTYYRMADIDSQSRTANPREQQQDRHVDLAYAITVHGAQGASERFAITLEGVEGGREPLVNRALSRAKEHVQVYTDNEAGWLNAIGKASSLSDNALGRAVLRGSQLTGDTLAHYMSPGKKYPQPHVMLPMYDANGKPAGAWLAPLADTQGKSVGGLPTQGRVLGSDSAQFVALQASRNNETRLAGLNDEQLRALLSHGELRTEDVKARLPEAVMREVMGQDVALRRDATVRQVAREPVSTRSRFQQDEQNLVRDIHAERELNKEKTQNGASRAAQNLLANAGVNVRTVNTYNFLHDKVIVVDGVTTETGSFNFSRAAPRTNSENVVVLRDMPEVAKQYLAHWQSRWAQGQDWQSTY